jgi:guanine deaminase
MKQSHEYYMTLCLEMASENVRSGQGGPFAALVVVNGNIIGKGVNRVTISNDPTAHAEVMAIRDACATVGHYHLENAVLYTSCEPCPMCLGAVYWARISSVFFAANRHDAADAGFNDALIYHEILLPHHQRSIPFDQVSHEKATTPFQLWKEMDSRDDY